MRKVMIVLALVALATLAGCSGSATTTSTTAQLGTVPSSSGDQPAEISIKDLAFTPAEVTVASGQEITWTNDDSTTHTVTFDDGSADQKLQPGETFTTTLSPGTHSYHCTIHPSMTGTVTVLG